MAILGYLECSIGTVEFIMTVGMVDSLLTYFYPLGTNMDGKRLAHSREKVVLAIAGPLENATVADKVASRPAVMAAVWMAFENLLGWVIVIYYDADEPNATATNSNTTNTANITANTTSTVNYTTANVSEWYFWVWGFAPTVTSLIMLGILSWLTTKPASSAKVEPAAEQRSRKR